MKNNEFQKIQFGYANAHAEAQENPNLLLNGFYDFFDVGHKIEKGAEWLILGYKGSGKSAVAERFRLIFKSNSQKFVRLVYIQDFQYMKFLNIVKEKEAVETILPTAWSWIIYTFLLNSFFEDNSVTLNNPEEFEEIKNSFKRMGLSNVTDIDRLVDLSSQSTFRLSLPKFAQKQWTKESKKRDIDIRWYLYNLRPYIAKLKSESKHYIIIDGLDDVLVSSKVQFDTISSLIFEANRVNQFLKENRVPAKLVVLCRTDIFELLKGANKNKIRQDYSIDLDWNSNPKKPNQSMLIKIANIRGGLSIGKEVDVIDYFLPKKIFSRSPKKYLLDMTRHTPRDFLQLMRYIQLSSKKDNMQFNEIKNGLREYSNKYFLPEIYDELNGYASIEEIQGIVKTISHLRVRDFNFNELVGACTETDWCPTPDILLKVLHALYECSAIGNVRYTTSKRKRFLSFKYRNRHSSFKRQERIILHRGLWRAFNLPTSSLTLKSKDETKIDPDIMDEME